VVLVSNHTYIGEDDEGSFSYAPEDPTDIGASIFVGLAGGVQMKSSTSESGEASMAQTVAKNGLNFVIRSYIKKLIFAEGV